MVRLQEMPTLSFALPLFAPNLSCPKLQPALALTVNVLVNEPPRAHLLPSIARRSTNRLKNGGGRRTGRRRDSIQRVYTCRAGKRHNTRHRRSTELQLCFSRRRTGFDDVNLLGRCVAGSVIVPCIRDFHRSRR